MSEQKDAIVPELVGLVKVLILRQEETNKNMREGFERLGLAITQTNANLDRLAKLTADGFQGVGSRLDALTVEVQRLHGHEERIRSLEAAVFRPGTRTRAARR
jgi:hypothetical protein